MTYNLNTAEWKAAMAKQLAEYNADLAACQTPVLSPAEQWQADFRLGRNISPGRGI